MQSMDKNFMVPVGGSIIFTQKEEILKNSNNFLTQFLVNTLVELQAVQ